LQKKFQVFISSTFTDLINERQQAVKAVLNANHIPAGMELFKANNIDQMNVIKKWIDNSDVFMLILGGRYGSLDADSQKSYTHLEYEYALEKKMPIFTLILNDSVIKENYSKSEGSHDDFFEKKNLKKYTKFKEQVKTNSVVNFLDSIYQIDAYVMGSLREFESDPDIGGWIRSNEPSADNHSFLQQIEELKSEISLLKDENRILTEENYLNRRLPGPKKESIFKFSNMMDVAELTMVSAIEIAPYTGINTPLTDMLSVLKNDQVQEEISSGITNHESPNEVLRYYISQNLIGFLSSNHIVHPFTSKDSNGSVLVTYRLSGEGIRFFRALNQEEDKL